jgi:hypothetical protein
MARTFQTYTRAPYVPYQCVVCSANASEENILIDLDKQIDFHGMVYLCYRCLVAISGQLGFVTPQVADSLREENASLNEKIKRIPLVTERLINDIRDISINASADLLADPTTVVLVNDEVVEQSNDGASEAERGDEQDVVAGSEPVVDKGSDSVPANPSGKRSTRSAVSTSTVSNG